MSAPTLGRRQLGVLRALNENGGYPTGAWYWESDSVTVTVLESLTKRGLVERTLRAHIDPQTGRPSYNYRINDAGREAL